MRLIQTVHHHPIVSWRVFEIVCSFHMGQAKIGCSVMHLPSWVEVASGSHVAHLVDVNTLLHLEGLDVNSSDGVAIV